MERKVLPRLSGYLPKAADVLTLGISNPFGSWTEQKILHWVDAGTVRKPFLIRTPMKDLEDRDGAPEAILRVKRPSANYSCYQAKFNFQLGQI